MENLICVLKDADEVKQSGSYEIPREINTVENYTQHLSITHLAWIYLTVIPTLI